MKNFRDFNPHHAGLAAFILFLITAIVVSFQGVELHAAAVGFGGFGAVLVVWLVAMKYSRHPDFLKEREEQRGIREAFIRHPEIKTHWYRVSAFMIAVLVILTIISWQAGGWAWVKKVWAFGIWLAIAPFAFMYARALERYPESAPAGQRFQSRWARLVKWNVLIFLAGSLTLLIALFVGMRWYQRRVGKIYKEYERSQKDLQRYRELPEQESPNLGGYGEQKRQTPGEYGDFFGTLRLSASAPGTSLTAQESCWLLETSEGETYPLRGNVPVLQDGIRLAVKGRLIQEGIEGSTPCTRPLFLQAESAIMQDALNYREGSRPRNPQFQLVPEGILIAWEEPVLSLEVEKYVIATGGGFVYRDVGETRTTRYLIPLNRDQSVCNLKVRITPVDRQGATMLPAYLAAGIYRKINPNDCGPQR